MGRGLNSRCSQRDAPARRDLDSGQEVLEYLSLSHWFLNMSHVSALFKDDDLRVQNATSECHCKITRRLVVAPRRHQRWDVNLPEAIAHVPFPELTGGMKFIRALHRSVDLLAQPVKGPRDELRPFGEPADVPLVERHHPQTRVPRTHCVICNCASVAMEDVAVRSF